MTLFENRTTSVEERTESEEPSSAIRASCALVIFATLPLELRERIYHYVLPPSLTLLYPLPPFLDPNPIADFTYNIMYVNKATHVDAGIYYLRSRRFPGYHSNEAEKFEKYLARFPGTQGYDAVRRLSFPCFSQVPVDEEGQNCYIDLIEKCTEILELALTFRPVDLQRGTYVQLWRMSEHPRRIVPGDLALVPVEAVIQRYSLSSLVKLRRIKRLEIFVKHAGVATRELRQQVRDTAPDQLMDDVCKWLRGAFSQRGMAVEVVSRSIR